MAKDKELHCSFCGKEQDEVNKLIAGTSGYICNECIELCHDMLLNEEHGEEAHYLCLCQSYSGNIPGGCEGGRGCGSIYRAVGFSEPD